MLGSAKHRATRPRRSTTSLLLLAGALVAAGGAATLVVYRHLLGAGLLALIGGGALLAASDDAARERPRRDVFGELVAERLYEASVLAPLAWILRHSSPHAAALALFGLGASFVASYERARGQSLGYRGGEGWAYRATRVALLSFLLLSGWVTAGLWVFVVLTAVAAAVRAWNVSLQERRRSSAATAASR